MQSKKKRLSTLSLDGLFGASVMLAAKISPRITFTYGMNYRLVVELSSTLKMAKTIES
jgi:hypothetical protein